MYYSLEDINNFDKLDFVMQIERKSGKQAAIHFCDFMTLILNKAKHSEYFNEINDKLSWSRIAVEHDGTPTLFCGSFSTKTFYIYTINDNQIKRKFKKI